MRIERIPNFQKILDETPQEVKDKIRKRMDEMDKRGPITPEEQHAQFTEILTANGFKPIAFSMMYLEDTFVFETQEEADRGYRLLERDANEKWIGKLVGWWYGKEDFLKAVKEYEKEMSEINEKPYNVKIYWQS